MHPFFISHGPLFRKNFTAKPFNIIDIYPLLCYILDVEPYPNNGSFANIEHILNGSKGQLLEINFQTTMITCTYISLFFCNLTSMKMHGITSKQWIKGRSANFNCKAKSVSISFFFQTDEQNYSINRVMC